MNILVTGGASGLGKSIVEHLAHDNKNNILFTYNNSLVAAVNIEKSFLNTKSAKCDFSKKEDVISLLEKINSFNIDVLINNAFSGKIAKAHFHKNHISVFENGFMNNILPVVRITQHAISIFRKKKYGKIITILSSALFEKPAIGWSEYIATKAYLHSLSKSWAVENAAFNITSNCISPALMQTDLTADIDERILEEIISKHPLKKILSTEEVADAVIYLVNASQQINGSNLIINAAENVI